MAANPDNVTEIRQTPTLLKALVAARKQIHNPKLDSTNPHFKSKFASLKSVYDSAIEALLDHGIVVLQDLQAAEGGMYCYTHLCHENGEEKVYGPMYFPCTKNDAQGYASASTYARRYHFMGVLCLVGDIDDDGNAASQSNFNSKQQKAKYYDGLKAAAAEEDALKCRELWDELNNEQRLELWADLRPSSRVRSTIKRLLSETDGDDVNE